MSIRLRAAAAVLVVVAACAAPATLEAPPAALVPSLSPIPTPSPSPSPSPSPTPTPRPLATFSFDAGVSEEQQQTIREALARAQAFITEMTGAPPPPVAVKVILSKSTAIEPRLTGACCAAYPGEILIDLDNADFAVPREAFFSKTAWLRHHVIHEYAHVWQQAQRGDQQRGCSRAPQWFIEGFAQFAAFETLARDGLVAREVSVRYTALQLRATAPADLPLRMVETSRTPIAYQAGYFANTLLARGGLAPFERFCAGFAAGEPWRYAFAIAFGTDIDSFYAEADRYILEVRQNAR